MLAISVVVLCWSLSVFPVYTANSDERTPYVIDKVQVDAKNYPSLNAAVSDIGVKYSTLVISSATSITSNLKIPDNISIMMLISGSINQGKHSLSIHGPFQAGLHNCFSGGGAVTFGNQSVTEVYPQWWGAKGNGTHDDTTAIQAAIDSYPVVVIPSGIFMTSIVNLRSGSQLIGKGIGNTILKLKANSNSYIIFGTNTSDVKIANLTLDGNSSNNPKIGVGVRFEGTVTRTTLENIRATDFRIDGIQFAGTNENMTLNTIKNCIADNNKHDGLTLSAFQSGLVSGCFANNNGRFGIVLGNSSNFSRVDNCTAFSNFDVNIIAVGSNDLIFNGNTTYRSKTAYGLQFNNVTRGIMSNNTAFGNFGVGLDCFQSTHCNYIGNIIFNNTLQGLAVDSTSHYTNVEGNQIYQNGGCGASCYRSANVAFIGNQFINNNQDHHPTTGGDSNPYGGSGLWVHDDGTITGNSGGTGLSSNIRIMGNTFADDQGAKATQIYGLQIDSGPTGCIISGNQFAGNINAPAYIADESAQIIYGNHGYSPVPRAVSLQKP